MSQYLLPLGLLAVLAVGGVVYFLKQKKAK
ncbi:MAG: QVPTGV class sortase B protein-sorting domain-containing protein [Thermodesulfobacteriota bacterium]